MNEAVEEFGHQGIEIYQCIKFRLPQLHAHMYCSRLVVVVFQEINCLHTLKLPMFVGSQSFISQPSFMFVSAPVSEIRELNQNKKKKEKKNSDIGYFQPFLGIQFTHFLNQKYGTCMHSIC